MEYSRLSRFPRGKFSRWITELEEYNYTVKYVPGVKNVKADPLSRNKSAEASQPESDLENKIYATRSKMQALSEKRTFIDQLKNEQDSDPVISVVKRAIEQGAPIVQGRLKRVQKQLRVESGLLVKSNRPVVPATFRDFVLAEIHNDNHFGVD